MQKIIFVCCMLALFCGLPAVAEVNINTASEHELSETLKNIGHVKAAAIVEYRETHGDFKSVDELVLVDGIGKSTVEMNREVLSIINKPSRGDAVSGSDR